MKRFGFIIFVLFALLAIFLPGFSRMQELRQENKDLRDKIVKAEKDNQSLEEQQEKLKTDPLYMEKVAREKMGITRKGETVYRINSDE